MINDSRIYARNFLVRQRKNISKFLKESRILTNFIFREPFHDKEIFDKIMGSINFNGDGFRCIFHIPLGVENMSGQGVPRLINTPTWE
jgi:hypothetical protein